jgi:hypothetical protein
VNAKRPTKYPAIYMALAPPPVSAFWTPSVISINEKSDIGFDTTIIK